MLVETLHTSNWPDIAARFLRMTLQICLRHFYQWFWLGFFVCPGCFCSKSGAQHAKMLSHWPVCTSEYLGRVEHSQNLCEPRFENTKSSLLLLGENPCRAFFARKYRISTQAGVGWLLWEASERPEVISRRWAEPQRRPNLLLQSTKYWGRKLRHRGSPKTAASAEPRTALCPTFPYFTYEQKETIKILLFPG